MKKFFEFLEAKGISKEDFLAKSVGEQAKLHGEFSDSLVEALNGKASPEDIKTALEAEKEGFKTFLAGEIATQLKETGVKASESQKYQLRKLVEEKHAEIVDAFKNGGKIQLEFKAAAMHMTNNGTVSNGSIDFPATDNFVLDNELAVIRYPENFILTVIPNRQLTKVPQTRIRKEQAAKEGAVALVAEGAVKPLQQYKWVRTATDRVKYAGRIEWSEEFEMDFEALYAAILNMFEMDVLRTWQDGILDQMISNASAYVASTLDDTLIAPDNGLAAVAIQSQIQSLNHTPDTCVMNPADLVATLFQQDANGNLKLAPYINTTTGTINGMRLIASNKIDQGDVLIGDSRLYREEHSTFIFRTGQRGDQLIENEYTAIGEVFSLLSIAEIDTVGWVYADLATVKGALLKPTV